MSLSVKNDQNNAYCTKLEVKRQTYILLRPLADDLTSGKGSRRNTIELGRVLSLFFFIIRGETPDFSSGSHACRDCGLDIRSSLDKNVSLELDALMRGSSGSAQYCESISSLQV